MSDGELAERLDMTEEAVRAQREQWEKEGVILGYQAVVNEEYEHDSKVAAFIEVKMTPERDGGFDRLAMRISRFDEVSSCYLASGGFDLLVLVEGKACGRLPGLWRKNSLRWKGCCPLPHTSI